MRPPMAIAAIVFTLAAPGVTFAQSAPLEYYQDLAKAGGQADGISMACGKTTQAKVDAHKAELRQQFAPHGLTPANFNRIYEGGYKEVIAQARANPALTKQQCTRLQTLGRH